MARILVTGSSGQVGGALKEELAGLGEVYAPGRAELDLAEPESIRRVMRKFRPEWVVNPAAYTAVDKAESEPELAFAINATAPQVMAEEAKLLGAAVLHFSTDYVFNGAKQSPYVESDPTGPLNVYGSTKLAGEQALMASGVPCLIFRTSWVFGATGKNFLLSILRLAREREHLKIVGDQYGAPTWSYDLARMTKHVISGRSVVVAEEGGSVAEAVAAVGGIYHAAGGGETTWCGFAQEAVAQLVKREPGTKLADVTAIPTSEYPTPAKRPVNSRMDCTKLQRELGWSMPPWQESVSSAMDELKKV